MKVLVSGGAGFIGSNVVRKLLDSGYSVVIVDNFSTGSKQKLHPHITYYEIDITTEELSEVVMAEKPNAIIHQAAQIDVQYSLRNPVRDANINIVGTINLLEAAKKAGVEKIVYASSAAVYGNPSYLPVDEQHPIDPLSFYGASKYAPELYFKRYSQLYGINYVILRYANVYGIGQEVMGEGGVVATFVNRITHGLPITIHGDGEQTRDFIYVTDVANANLNALQYGSNIVCNVSCNKQTSINELVHVLNEIAGTNHLPEYLEQRPGDIMHSRLDNTLAFKEIQWQPKYSLYQGLRETYQYHLKLSEEMIVHQ